MTRYNVLIPSIFLEEEQTSYGKIKTESGYFDIIDTVSYDGTPDECRDSLIRHDNYPEYIICIPDTL